MRCLIVEDEPLARAKLLDLLHAVSWIDAVDVADTVARGRECLMSGRVDLVFLDVHLPDGRGLALLELIAPTTVVVFTTAFDEYAVTAFELQALDYLVKPFSAQRFAATLERIHRVLARPDDRLSSRASAAVSSEPPTRIFARVGNDLIPIELSEVDRIEGFDDHAAVWRGGRRYLVFRRLKELEALLAPAGFLRVHRSHLVNVAHVTGLQSSADGRLAVVLSTGARVVASKARTSSLRHQFELAARIGLHAD